MSVMGRLGPHPVAVTCVAAVACHKNKGVTGTVHQCRHTTHIRCSASTQELNPYVLHACLTKALWKSGRERLWCAAHRNWAPVHCMHAHIPHTSRLATLGPSCALHVQLFLT